MDRWYRRVPFGVARLLFERSDVTEEVPIDQVETTQDEVPLEDIAPEPIEPSGTNADGSSVYPDPNPTVEEEGSDIPPGFPEGTYYEDRDGERVLVVPDVTGGNGVESGTEGEGETPTQA